MALRHYKNMLKKKEKMRKAAVLVEAIAMNRRRLLEQAEQPAKLWEWWWSRRDEEEFSQWCLLARIAVLHQPSSAVIERFFSVYKGMTSTQQCAEDPETSMLRAYARYNKGKVGL